MAHDSGSDLTFHVMRFGQCSCDDEAENETETEVYHVVRDYSHVEVLGTILQ